MRSRFWLLTLVYLFLPLAPVVLISRVLRRRRARRMFSQYRRVARVDGSRIEFEDGSNRTLEGVLRGRVIRFGGERIDAPCEVCVALDEGVLFRGDEAQLEPVLKRLEKRDEPARELQPDDADGLLIPAALAGLALDAALTFAVFRSV